MSEQFSSNPGPAAAGRLEMAPGLDSIDAGAAPPISAAAPNGRGPTYGYGSNVIGDGEVHLLDYVKVLYKRRWTAITAFLVVFLSVTIYTFTATPIYEAKVQILIEKENTNVVTFKEAFEQNQIADDYYQTQYKILQSRALARRTIDGLKLWEHPLLKPNDENLTVGKIAAAPTDSVSLEDKQNIVVQKLADLNAAVTRAKTERIQKEAAHNQLRGLQHDRNALDTFPAILSNTFIQQQKGEIAELQRQQAQLSEKLGPRHPDMLKVSNAIQLAESKLQGEIAKVVQSVKNEYQAALIQEQTLTGALDQQKRDALALSRKGIDYGALQRDNATNRQVFESLLQRAKETGVSTELKTSNIRVVDAAEVPRRPASPNVPTNLLLAFFGGGTLALGLAFFFEYLDNRIKTPDEVKAHLGLPFLGMVPALFGDDVKDPLMNNGVPANFAEAFRAIRTNVLFSSAEEGSKTIVITSTAPGEGKTTVASNIAIALAQASQRVLVVDADMRKPRVHSVFGQTQEPGLSNVLVGNAKASEAIRGTAVSGLWPMTAGMLPPNPSELLGSKRFKDFVSTLGQHFDWVIIDTPPVMAVTDSVIASNVAQGVVFVLGAEMTSRHTAQRAIEQLANGKAKFVGAVLNRVDLQHHGYYYSQYYRREYGAYYQSAPAN